MKSPNQTRRILLGLAVSLGLPACAISPLTQDEIDVPEPSTYSVGRYFKNRGFDFGDMFKFGVEVGPGLGADLMVTEYLRAAAMKRWSKGIGFETFRHSPLKSAEESYAELGPVVRTEEMSGVVWPRDRWDIRAEAHLLVLGAHLAINPVEMLDFLAGLATLDPMDDDGL